MRFVEPPTKKDGNPFMAFRAPKPLKVAFAKHAKSKGATPAELLRGYMAKVTGVAAEDDNGE